MTHSSRCSHKLNAVNVFRAQNWVFRSHFMLQTMQGILLFPNGECMFNRRNNHKCSHGANAIAVYCTPTLCCLASKEHRSLHFLEVHIPTEHRPLNSSTSTNHTQGFSKNSSSATSGKVWKFCCNPSNLSRGIQLCLQLAHSGIPYRQDLHCLYRTICYPKVMYIEKNLHGHYS